VNRKQRRKMVEMTISFCPDHGSYNKENLCPCYDPGGPLADQRKVYGTKPWSKKLKFEPLSNASGEQIGFCPIHGEAIINDRGVFQCGCFDENGNKIVHLTDNPNEKEEF